MQPAVSEHSKSVVGLTGIRVNGEGERGKFSVGQVVRGLITREQFRHEFLGNEVP